MEDMTGWIKLRLPCNSDWLIATLNLMTGNRFGLDTHSQNPIGLSLNHSELNLVFLVVYVSKYNSINGKNRVWRRVCQENIHVLTVDKNVTSFLRTNNFFFTLSTSDLVRIASDWCPTHFLFNNKVCQAEIPAFKQLYEIGPWNNLNDNCLNYNYRWVVVFVTW